MANLGGTIFFLQDSTDPAELAAWIKAHVDPTYHSSQGFISALMTVIFKFVYEVSS